MNTDKFKEDFLELILNVVPLSQIGFVFIMAVVIDYLGTGLSSSPINTFDQIGIAKLISVDNGLFWKVDLKIIGISFFLALLNTWLIRYSLTQSFSIPKLPTKILGWVNIAAQAIGSFTEAERSAVQASLDIELKKRVKKYYAKRLLVEFILSIAGVIIGGSIYLVILNYNALDMIKFSLLDFLWLMISLIFWLFFHRKSVEYALSKVLPLQVYLSVTTGEIVFFENSN